MFNRILIANRGEIACRIMRTARRLGIETVAVYSEADAGAMHTRLADIAVPIGPAPAAESYLDMKTLVAVAREVRAQAVHPGFGFLAENAGFARALARAKIAFIGPGLKAIAVMGDKIESKKIAELAGVNTVPGYTGTVAGAGRAAKIAARIGYPVMVKAAAGGGGKGMRVVASADALEEAVTSAMREAKSSFGDSRIFIEKFIEEPRHIEIQVLGDSFGNLIHLGERECSIQRRHQKVIEEAPSPFLDDEMRGAMGAQAVSLAKAVNYRSAGTVEFIVDRERNFYFLEMNTRLQVEHPVTEAITGIDLVEEMIRIAAGEKLRLAQKDVEFDGWAIEARLYAEDPARGFVPSTGRLSRYRAPESAGAARFEAGSDIRLDTGVEEGDEISMHYDPMIAKLVTRGRDRGAAISEMRAALDGMEIEGPANNRVFLAAIMARPRFAEGRINTAFIEDEFPDGYDGAAEVSDAHAELFAAVAACAARRDADRGRRATDGLRSPAGREGAAEIDLVVVMGDAQHALRIGPSGDGYDIRLNGRRLRIDSDWRPGERLFRGVIDNRVFCVQIAGDSTGYRLSHDGAEAVAAVMSPRVAELARLMPEKISPDMSRYLLSPMPGLLLSVSVKQGQTVKTGEALAVVEAMKMENVLRAERDGRIATLHAATGDSLAVDQAILEFD